MRRIKPREAALICFLAQKADINLRLETNQRVCVINPEMGSIRADYCPKGVRVNSAAQFEFEDKDGGSIVATLLVTEGGEFGELDFWKVDDSPVLLYPFDNAQFLE